MLDKEHETFVELISVVLSTGAFVLTWLVDTSMKNI